MRENPVAFASHGIERRLPPPADRHVDARAGQRSAIALPTPVPPPVTSACLPEITAHLSRHGIRPLGQPEELVTAGR